MPRTRLRLGRRDAQTDRRTVQKLYAPKADTGFGGIKSFQMSNSFDLNQTRLYLRPDLGPNCLQR